MQTHSTVRLSYKARKSIGSLLGILLGLISSTEFLMIVSLSQAPAQAQSGSSLQKPLPPIYSPSYKTPLANPKSGFILPDNTTIKLKFKETISSKTAEENRPIEFDVAEDIVVQGVTVIARGTTAKGMIAEVKRAKMLGRKGKISIILKVPASLRAVDCLPEPLRSQPLLRPFSCSWAAKKQNILQGLSLRLLWMVSMH
jgi:hypothetical protein